MKRNKQELACRHCSKFLTRKQKIYCSVECGHKARCIKRGKDYQRKRTEITKQSAGTIPMPFEKVQLSGHKYWDSL